MAVQVPPEVNWLLDILCGQSWPEGDEDALRRCAQAWQEAAQGLGDLAGYLDSSAQNVLASADSMSADDYNKFWKTYIHDGDGTYVALFKHCEPLVKQLFAQATEVEYTKIVIVVTLILTAIQIAIAIAAATGTFGGSLAEIPLALFVGRQTIVMVVARFVEMALMMLIPDLVAQTVMFAQGHGWDGSKTVGAFENALAAGTIAAVLGPLAGKLPWMSEEAAQTIGGKLEALATHFVEGGAVNDLTALATMGTNYGLASLTGNQDWQKQIAQQWSSTNWVAQFAQGGVLADAFYAAHMFGHDGVPMTFTGSDGKSYTVYLDDAALSSLRDTGQLPARYQARVFGDNGVQVGDATFNGAAISFDKPINGQPGADLGTGFTVAGHDGSQFRFQPSDQTGPDGQPRYHLVSRVQKSADPITVPNADAGGDPLEFPPGSVVHYDNGPGPDGTMTGQPYRVEVTEGNVVKIYQAEQPGGPFELTGQVVHSSGILRFFGADAPKYYGPDGPGDGATQLATVSLVTGKSTTNDLPGYITAHVDRWAPGAPASPADPAGRRIVDAAAVTPADDGQRAGQEADSAAAVGVVDASAFVYAQQVQQAQRMLQSHPELFDLVPRGGPPPEPEAPREWPQLFRTVDRGIDVPEDLNGLAETDVAGRLARSRQDYEEARQSLESKYRRDIEAYENADTSVHTLERLDQERLDRTAKYQADLRTLASDYQAADRKILLGELRRVRTTLELLKELDPEIAEMRDKLQQLTQRIEAMRREGGHSAEELRAADQERRQALARRAELQSVSERRTLLAGTEKRIDDALSNLDDEYRKQMAGIDAGLAQELAQRPHLDLDRIYAADLVRLDREWASAERLPPADRLRRFGELQRQLRDLEVGLSRQHEALRIGPDAEEARRWVRAAFDRALAENRARGVPRAEATARKDVVTSIDQHAARLEAQIDRLIRSTGPGREPSPKVGELQRTVAELRRLRDIVQADPAATGSNPLHPVLRSPIAQVAADPAVADAVRDVLASLPPDVREVPGGGRDVHAAYEMLFDGTRLGPFRVDSGTAVADAESRWVRNAAGGVLNYLQEHGGVPGELRVGSLADRRTDAEFQIVAKVRGVLEGMRRAGTEPHGEVVIAASKLMCPSCQMALHELMGEFPGINVVLASGTVTVILDPHMADVRPLSGLYDVGFGVRVEHVPLDPAAAGTMGRVASGAGVNEADYPQPVPTKLAATVDLPAALDPPGNQAALSDLAGKMRAEAAATGRTQYIIRDEGGELRWVEAGRNGILNIPEPSRDPGQVLLLADDPRQRVVAQTAWREVTAESAEQNYSPEQFDGRLIIPPAGDAVRLVPVERGGSAGSEPPASWRDDVVSRSIADALTSSPHDVAVAGHPDVPGGFSRVDLPVGLDRLAGLVHKMPDRIAGYTGSDQKMIELVRQVPGVKGAHLVDMHGDAAGPWDPSSPQSQSRLSVSDVRDLLVAAGWDGEQPVVLMSCDAAQSSYAADLAAELGVRVIAPTARVWQVGETVFICGVDGATGLPDLSKPGHWEEFGGENPGPVAADEHGMPVLEAPHPDAVKADVQQAVNALRVLGGHPEPVPAELSRSPILDALNPPGGHYNWLAAGHGRDLLPTHLAIEPADVPADLTPLTPPTGLGDLAGLVYARTDGNGVVISSDPEHLAAAATGEDSDAFRLYAVGGGGQAWAPGGRDLSPDELFMLAKEAGWDGSRPLDLVVCQGGAGDDASLAAGVQAAARSEFPDAVVRGATDWVWQDPATGERVVAPALWDPATGHFLPHPERRGTWVRFPPDDNVVGHAGAPHDHQPAAQQRVQWVHWADSTTPHRRDWPADPVTGQPLTHHDLDFLGLTEQQVEWWRSGEAPLGMTPDTYHAWIKDLRDALREDGIPPETVDVRLLGSSARGFSGPHKRLPSDSEIAERYPPEVARAALERKAEWLGQDTQRLQSRPFDAMNKLGLDEPSDYDTNISCDLMVERARAQWQADGQPGPFLSGDHEYVNKDVAGETFPHLQDWADRWSALLGRDVSWAVFPSTGPKDVSASGHFVHFQDDDWIVMTPGGSQDADD